jgi:hypothetical protein
MYKQANVYRHNVLDVEELLNAPMGGGQFLVIGLKQIKVKRTG